MSRLPNKFLTIIVASLPMIVPIIWGWWSNNTQLTIDTKSIATIVSSSQPINGLEFSFNGKTIANLNRVLLELKNSGRTPITKNDVISPITLMLGDGEILEATLVHKAPKNIDISLGTKGRVLVVDFPLLNPGEYVEISVLTTSSKPELVADARIKNISQIELTDSSNSIVINPDVTASIVVVGLCGIIFAYVGFSLGGEIPKKWRALRSLDLGVHKILLAATHTEAREQLYMNLDFLSDENRKKADMAIDKSSWPLDDMYRDGFKNEIIEAVKAEECVISAITSLFLAALAFWFVASRLVA